LIINSYGKENIFDNNNFGNKNNFFKNNIRNFEEHEKIWFQEFYQTDKVAFKAWVLDFVEYIFLRKITFAMKTKNDNSF
jgi:hypothetical protein